MLANEVPAAFCAIWNWRKSSAVTYGGAAQKRGETADIAKVIALRLPGEPPHRHVIKVGGKRLFENVR